MKAGEFPDGAHVLRLKIDMASPNINMRDPTITGSATRRTTAPATSGIYPLYDYTHCISTAERITHSICTLEFQDHRPLTTGCWPSRRAGGCRARCRNSTSSRGSISRMSSCRSAG
jgi:hypothetical protein